MYKSLNAKVYDRALTFVSSTTGIVFLAVWSFCEASFWFVAPDFLLVIFAFLKPTHKNKFFAVALLASFLGGVVYYILNLFALDSLGEILRHTPFVTDRMILFVQETYGKYGHLGVLFQSFTFMSFKIWTNVAVVMGLNPIIYFPLVMISRVFRLYPVTWLSAYISRYTTNFLKNNFLVVLAGYVILFFTMLIVLEN